MSPSGFAPLADDVRQRGVDGQRLPADPQRDVKDVHAEIAHATVFAVEARLPFPVDRLGGVQIAGVKEFHADFDHAAKPSLGDPPPNLLSPGIERQLRGDPDELSGASARLGDDRLGGIEVDAERLLRQQVLARDQHIDQHFFVEVVRDGAVDGVDPSSASSWQ